MKQQNVLDAQYELDQKSNGINLKHDTGTKLVRQNKIVMIGYYDFATDATKGAVGTILLNDCNGRPATLPKGAIITSTYIDVITAPTSGGSPTIAFSSGVTAADLKAATAIASLGVGVVAGIQVGVAANALKLTADSLAMSIAIATAALTAGKFNVIVEMLCSF
jgi:hypothetical protein